MHLETVEAVIPISSFPEYIQPNIIIKNVCNGNQVRTLGYKRIEGWKRSVEYF